MKNLTKPDFPGKFRISPRPPHPKGIKAKVLFSCVPGPYAVNSDDSRVETPMELCHSQITRYQGGFTIREHTMSYNLKLLACNLDAPCYVLDFPTWTQFENELINVQYDIIGITSIITNYEKTKKMCDIIRKYQPETQIIIGGHIVNDDVDLQDIDADYMVLGEGITWLREYLGQNPDENIKHPITIDTQNTIIGGVSIPTKFTLQSAPVFVGVGCPFGCTFCKTSAKFGGKGSYIPFLKTGDDIFNVCNNIEKETGIKRFNLFDENFLSFKARALRFLELMKANNKDWEINAFGSAKALESYDPEELARMGLGLVWMGIEGSNQEYDKLKGTDTIQLVKKLQSYGISFIGSSIMCSLNHTPENIDYDIDYAIKHNVELMQFMQYYPTPGTPLFKELHQKGMINDLQFTDYTAQKWLNFDHPNIPSGMEIDIMKKAFAKDFEINGPSIIRILRTQFEGYNRYKNSDNKAIKKRFSRTVNNQWAIFSSAMTWSARKYFKKKGNPPLVKKMNDFLNQLHNEFGKIVTISTPIMGRLFYKLLTREEKKQAKGHQYEPYCTFSKNDAALSLEDSELEKTKRKKIKINDIPWIYIK